MPTKIYEKLKRFFKENYKILVFFVLLNIILIIPVPYYIYIGGGIMDVNDKIIIENSYDKKGSFNLAYVDQINATVSSFLLSYIIPGWDLESVKDSQLNQEESNKDIEYRDQQLLKIANNNATLIAYQLAKKDIKVETQEYVILYLLDKENNFLEVGDIILKYDDITMDDYDDFISYIGNKKIGDNINLQIKRKGDVINFLVNVKNIDGQKKLGIGAYGVIKYTTDPSISFSFKSNELGPSGGLITALAIYNKLVKEDITKGLKIAGTGAITSDGSVQEIAGVKYKLKGAVKRGADVFLVPEGANYQEALKIKAAHHYTIKILAVKNVADAINKLKTL